MSLVEINWYPTPRQVRQFGLLCIAGLPAIGWASSASATTLVILATTGMLLAAAAVVLPKLIAPLFIGLMLITVPIGLVVGELAMLLIYIVVFLPIGLTFRLLGRDRLELRFNRAQASYWKPKLQPRSVASYYRQS